MVEEQWDDPEELVARYIWDASDRKRRLFGVACCRRALGDGRAAREIADIELYADREWRTSHSNLVKLAENRL